MGEGGLEGGQGPGLDQPEAQGGAAKILPQFRDNILLSKFRRRKLHGIMER